ncbi:MAG: helix-turn-helix domain-containing protein [Acidimicrobiales bacterium]|jgi:excisionase family DNA binding protein
MKLLDDGEAMKFAATGPTELDVDDETRATTTVGRSAALLISVEDAASILGIGRTLTFELILQGKISSVKIGRRRLVVRQELDEFVRELSISQNSNHFAEHYLN